MAGGGVWDASGLPRPPVSCDCTRGPTWGEPAVLTADAGLSTCSMFHRHSRNREPSGWHDQKKFQGLEKSRAPNSGAWPQTQGDVTPA